MVFLSWLTLPWTILYSLCLVFAVEKLHSLRASFIMRMEIHLQIDFRQNKLRGAWMHEIMYTVSLSQVSFVLQEFSLGGDPPSLLWSSSNWELKFFQKTFSHQIVWNLKIQWTTSIFIKKENFQGFFLTRCIEKPTYQFTAKNIYILCTILQDQIWKCVFEHNGVFYITL